MLLLQHQIMSLETLKRFYFLTFVASLAKNGSVGQCFTKMCLIGCSKNMLGNFLISHETHKIQVYRRARKLKCFQNGMAHNIKILIELCRPPNSLENSL